MPEIVTSDGTRIYYKDWGNGQPVVFSHGWPLNSDAWDEHMLTLASRGYRCIAHDRRGHGRSTHTWAGNDMDHYWRSSRNRTGCEVASPDSGGGAVSSLVYRHPTDQF